MVWIDHPVALIENLHHNIINELRYETFRFLELNSKTKIMNKTTLFGLSSPHVKKEVHHGKTSYGNISKEIGIDLHRLRF